MDGPDGFLPILIMMVRPTRTATARRTQQMCLFHHNDSISRRAVKGMMVADGMSSSATIDWLPFDSPSMEGWLRRSEIFRWQTLVWNWRFLNGIDDSSNAIRFVTSLGVLYYINLLCWEIDDRCVEFLFVFIPKRNIVLFVISDGL